MIELDSSLIAELAAFPWFKNCGRPPDGVSFATRPLNGWNEVRRAAADPAWTDSVEEAQGQLTSYLSDRWPEDHQARWNVLVREARPSVAATAGAAAQALAERHDLGQPFIDTVDWDVLHGVMETTYSSRNPPMFFRRLMVAYRAGHVPCGLDDDGTVAVY